LGWIYLSRFRLVMVRNVIIKDGRSTTVFIVHVDGIGSGVDRVGSYCRTAEFSVGSIELGVTVVFSVGSIELGVTAVFSVGSIELGVTAGLRNLVWGR
jgi:hypothetical protein